MVTLCGTFRSADLLFSGETDEEFDELPKIGWITTFVTDAEPS